MVKLYTTHCPKCRVIETKLNSKSIQYEEITDIDKISEKGFQVVPVLEVNGDILDFKEANDWLNNYIGD